MDLAQNTVHWENGPPTGGGPASDCIVTAERGFFSVVHFLRFLRDLL
jgi:hypothetical protein